MAPPKNNTKGGRGVGGGGRGFGRGRGGRVERRGRGGTQRGGLGGRFGARNDNGFASSK